MKRTLWIVVFIVIALAVVVGVSAWVKNSGADCQRVFASITNENDTLDYEGYVKENGNAVVTIAGTAAPHDVVTAEWTPTPNFTGTVEAYVALFDVNGRVADSTLITDVLACQAPTGTPTPSATPSATLTPVVTPGPTDVPPPTTDGLSSCPSCTQAPKAPEPTRLPGPVGWK